MTEPAPPAVAGLAVESRSGPVDWHLELHRRLLLPGRLVDGRVRLQARNGVSARGLVVTLVGVEHWRHRVTRTDGQGHTTTQVVRSEGEPVREPVRIAEGVRLAAGEVLDQTFQLPVPPLGPASLEADDAGMDWTLEAKLDIEGGLDSSIETPVVVAQPTALLRAGAVPVGEFALYAAADSSADGVAATIQLEPMPLVCGEPFEGELRLAIPGSLRLQEVRVELRVRVEATVSQGEHEELTVWSAAVAGPGELGGSQAFAVRATLPTARFRRASCRTAARPRPCTSSSPGHGRSIPTSCATWRSPRPGSSERRGVRAAGRSGGGAAGLPQTSTGS